MGIFSRKKERIVSTAIQRMVEDDALPDTVRVALIRAIMDDSPNASIPEHLINAFANSLALKVDRLYDWAVANYTYGMVESDLRTTRDGEDIAKALVETAIGETITIDYFEFAPINWLHVGWMKLIEDYDYNPVTNELEDLTTSVGFPVYLHDLEQVFTPASYAEQTLRSLEQWGVPQQSGLAPERPLGNILGEYLLPSPVVSDDAATEDHILVTYSWVDGTGVTQFDTVEVSLAGYDDEPEYYHMKYRYNDGVDDHIGYWLYEKGSDLESSLEAIHDFPFTGAGSYLPWVHFRRSTGGGEDNMGDESYEGTDDFVSSTDLMEFFGMDYQGLCEEFHANPDIGDLEQIMMMIAVDIDDESEVGMRYLYDHFDYLWTLGDSQIDWHNDAPSGVRFAQVLQDRVFRMSFQHGGISKRRKAGMVAAIGRHARETVEVYTPKKKKGIIGGIATLYNDLVADNAYVFRRQITAQVYDEIRVYRPSLTFHIHNEASFDAGFKSDALLIPIDYNILQAYSLPERELLVARSMHFVYNTLLVVKTEWYQTAGFKALLMIAAVVVTVWSGYDMVTTAMAAFAAGGAIAVAQLVITNIIIGLVIMEGLKILVQLVGGDLALIIAAVGMVVAISRGNYGFSGVKGAPWADELLRLSNGLIQAIDAYTEDLIGNLQEDYEQFSSFVESKTKLLDDAKDLLKTSTLINPFEFVGLQPFSLYDEEPEDYFKRTIHAGNVGTQVLNAISGYVDNALTLPRLTETLGVFDG